MVNREEKHLENIIEAIRAQIEYVDRMIHTGQQEVAGMNEYYWESYTEMDEYGYEIYDNQRALLQQVSENQNWIQYKNRLKKMVEEPYFGRVDFCFEDEDEAEPFYIGIGNFARKRGDQPLIYDWRAPVSALFYDYDRGKASYMAPYGEIFGEITSKWQYKIKNGKMVYAIESDVKIDDNILIEELGHSGDVQLKNIVRTIQKEQNAIIRNTKDKIMVIQGAAGSGKTSIALHRIAYLLYHERESLKSSNVLILSPNGVFTDYISHILPELGEENIQEMSFDIFAYRELRDVIYDCEDRYDYLEKQMKYPDLVDEKVYKEKQSKAMLGLIESYLAFLEEDLVEFKDIEFRGMKLTEQELIDLFYFRFQSNPLLTRMDVIREYFIDQYETLKGKHISNEDQEFLEEVFHRMYVSRDIYKIYSDMLEFGGYEPLPKVEYEKRVLPYEDVYPLLYFKYRLLGKKRRKQVKHLVIDEMQDYSYLQYEIIHDMFQCKMTVLGDRAQTLETKKHDVMKFFPKIFGELKYIEIKKSYRNTMEIANYAKQFLEVDDLEYLDRHGKPVEELECKKLEECLDSVEEKMKEESYETAAIITRDEDTAKMICQMLKKRNCEASLLDKNSVNFPKGLIVTTWYMAKGLEFDQVFGIMEKKENAFDAQVRYIAATRALHELNMYTYAQ